MFSAAEGQVISEEVSRGPLHNAVAEHSRRHIGLEGVGHRYSLIAERLRIFFNASAELIRANKRSLEEYPHARKLPMPHG